MIYGTLLIEADTVMAKPGGTTNRWTRQLSALIVLTVQNTVLVLLTKLSFRGGAAHYLASTVVVCAELLKLVTSCVLLAHVDGRNAIMHALRETKSQAVRLALPSVLYVIQNNLLFEGMRLLSPTLYMVCSQNKILTSALFSALILRTSITRSQCVALVLLVCGMIIVQHTEETSHSVYSHSVGTHKEHIPRGVFVVVTATFTSGFAGAYLEKLYKENKSKRSIWYCNAQLAIISLPLAILTSCYKDHEQLWTEGVFHGYDRIVMSVIMLQAMGGLTIAAVLRYAGNVLKCYAICISICSVVAATEFCSDSGNDSQHLNLVVGIILVVISIFMYSNVHVCSRQVRV